MPEDPLLMGQSICNIVHKIFPPPLPNTHTNPNAIPSRSTSSQPGINSRAAVLGNGGNLWQPPPPPFAKILSKDRLKIEKIHAER